jgi:hypothetical protein
VVRFLKILTAVPGLPSARFSFYRKDALRILGTFRGSDNSA